MGEVSVEVAHWGAGVGSKNIPSGLTHIERPMKTQPILANLSNTHAIGISLRDMQCTEGTEKPLYFSIMS
jgi:hypothetical protein